MVGRLRVSRRWIGAGVLAIAFASLASGCLGASSADKRAYEAIQNDPLLSTHPANTAVVEQWSEEPCSGDSQDQGSASTTYRTSSSRQELIAFYRNVFGQDKRWTFTKLYRASEPDWYLAATERVDDYEVIANVEPSPTKKHEYTLTVFFDPKPGCGLF